MADLRFYPYLTDELKDICGCNANKYRFVYYVNGIESGLMQKGTNVIKLSDPTGDWDLKLDGITLKRTVSIAYPDLLYGLDGIACRDAELGICIIWTNNRLTQTGHILPKSDISNQAGRTCYFEHTFPAGEIDGDLELALCMYIKKAATNIKPDEIELMNEEGVFVGEIDNIVIDFESVYMEFPIEECNSPNEPMWWIEFSPWEDPKSIEKFTKDNICLYLNRHYPACPMTDGSIKNIDLLIDILATAYFMMFQRLSEEDLAATRNNVGLEPNSICSILYQFISETDLRFETPELLLKSLQLNLRSRLAEEEI